MMSDPKKMAVSPRAGLLRRLKDFGGDVADVREQVRVQALARKAHHSVDAHPLQAGSTGKAVANGLVWFSLAPYLLFIGVIGLFILSLMIGSLGFGGSYPVGGSMDKSFEGMLQLLVFCIYFSPVAVVMMIAGIVAHVLSGSDAEPESTRHPEDGSSSSF
jgi:hypothetical protein